MAIKIGNKEIVDGDDHATFNNIITGIQDKGYAIRVGNKGFQGNVSGYTSGGFVYPGAIGRVNTIDKFPFSVDANATDVGDLTQVRNYTTGQSSTTHGYTSGGISASETDVIDKFPFSVDANATDVGDLTQVRRSVAGQSSETHGYTSAGEKNASGFDPAATYNTIDKFDFFVDANATDVGDLTQARRSVAGQSSETHGYTSGGETTINTIDKFPFATDANATDVGNLTQGRHKVSGQSSREYGYTSGGDTGIPYSDVIDKFSFASDANATDVGNLTEVRDSSTGQSSETHGYASGGARWPAVPMFNTIDKFPFFSDSNATDVADLTQARSTPAGQQV